MRVIGFVNFLIALMGFLSFGASHLSHIPFLRDSMGKDPKVYARSDKVWVVIRPDGRLDYLLPDGTLISEHFPRKGKVLLFEEDRLNLRVKKYFGKEFKEFKAFSRVWLKGIYRGIDLELKLRGRKIEKLFHIAPHTDISKLRINIGGNVDRIEVNEEGGLNIYTKGGVIKFSKPVAYQIINGNRVKYEASYILKDNYYTFKVKNYDKSKPLIIDPLLYATLFGGNDIDTATELAIDSQDYVYIVGGTSSTNLNVNNQYGTPLGQGEAFIAKFSEDLSNLVALTIMGGSNRDWFTSLAIKGNEIYVSGSTFSSDFPGTNCNNLNSQNAVLAKFDSNLNLLASVCDGDIQELGGNSMDIFYDLVLDDKGNIYTAGASRNVSAGPFVVYSARFDQNLNKTGYFIGIPAPNPEEGVAYAITVDNQGFVYLGGESPDIEGFACKTNQSNTQRWGFIVKIDPHSYSIPALVPYQIVKKYCLGRSVVRDLKYDSNYIYATGATSGKVALGNPYQPNIGGSSDAFAGYFDLNLNPQTITYLGGKGEDAGDSLEVANNSVYITGSTNSVNFPVTQNAFDKTHTNSLTGGNTYDIFVSRLSKDLRYLLSSTLYGGRDSEDSNGIDINSKRCVYVAGETNSNPQIAPDPNTTTFLPVTQGAYQTVKGSLHDSFIIAFTENLGSGYASSNKDNKCREGCKIFKDGNTEWSDKCYPECSHCIINKGSNDPPIYDYYCLLDSGCLEGEPTGGGCFVQGQKGIRWDTRCDPKNCKELCKKGTLPNGAPFYDMSCMIKNGCIAPSKKGGGCSIYNASTLCIIVLTSLTTLLIRKRFI